MIGTIISMSQLKIVQYVMWHMVLSCVIIKLLQLSTLSNITSVRYIMLIIDWVMLIARQSNFLFCNIGCLIN